MVSFAGFRRLRLYWCAAAPPSTPRTRPRVRSCPGARDFVAKPPQNKRKMHAFWLPKQQCNQPQPPQPPHWSTRPTGPVDHPADPPTHRAPHPHPTLALGLRTLGAPGPPPGPCFPVFVFFRPPASCDPPGRPLTERSKTLRPAALHARYNHTMYPLYKNTVDTQSVSASTSDTIRYNTDCTSCISAQTQWIRSVSAPGPDSVGYVSCMYVYVYV